MGNCLITRRGGTSGGGGTSGYYWKVEYYSSDGNTLLHTQYVVDGQDAPSYNELWNTSTGQSSETPGILNNISQNLTVYQALATALIPIMTSYTTPSGEVTSSGNLSTGTPKAWQVFNGIMTSENAWLDAVNNNNGYIAYAFANSALKEFQTITISVSTSNAGGREIEIYIEGQKSDGTWENCLAEGTMAYISIQAATRKDATFSLNHNSYKAIRVRSDGITPWSNGNSDLIGWWEIQVYGSND